ncbi:Arf-GAP with SH3 domain, ANK repeat and PH domain-containing protein 1 [Acipenser ruthenus]|uniref:Arf-GAP with SH3 domain, ANK repeat and PH domain-containing protein 1 n=1 Tax=Acipenser ruthenus TaxID=7906 RepID=A0A662YKZ9_ACIRT|nr:Arf-GAP with SH3 domain, ANK repeat and PH domain-containing protein 1 [Acipenser ruthenus]
MLVASVKQGLAGNQCCTTLTAQCNTTRYLCLNVKIAIFSFNAFISLRYIAYCIIDYNLAVVKHKTYEDSQSKQGGYSMHQLQGNKEFGSEKKGYLSKKSDGLRKVWQRRKCSVKNGILTISHATSNRQPVKLNLLTCQVKPNGDDKKCFDLISHNRTYHFQAEDEQEFVM